MRLSADGLTNHRREIQSLLCGGGCRETAVPLPSPVLSPWPGCGHVCGVPSWTTKVCDPYSYPSPAIKVPQKAS